MELAGQGLVFLVPATLLTQGAIQLLIIIVVSLTFMF